MLSTEKWERRNSWKTDRFEGRRRRRTREVKYADRRSVEIKELSIIMLGAEKGQRENGIGEDRGGGGG